MVWKIEYRKGDGEWQTMHVNSLTLLMTESRNLRSQGFEVRCLNEVGRNII